MKTTSKSGEILDGIADFIMIIVVFVIFIPLLVWEHWILYWIAGIAFIRFLSSSVGYAKYKALPFLHTYSNKATGIALACFPIFYHMFGLTITAYILCGIATLSALEELTINIRSKELNRNIASILSNAGGRRRSNVS